MVLGVSSGVLRASWEPLGASWERLGSLSGRLGSVLADFWSHLGTFRELKRDLEGSLEAILRNFENPSKTM